MNTASSKTHDYKKTIADCFNVVRKLTETYGKVKINMKNISKMRKQDVYMIYYSELYHEVIDITLYAAIDSGKFMLKDFLDHKLEYRDWIPIIQKEHNIPDEAVRKALDEIAAIVDKAYVDKSLTIDWNNLYPY